MSASLDSRPPAAIARARHPAARWIRWVLLCFVMSLGVAIASPIVHPQAVELVCSSAGAVKAVVQTDDGAQELGAGHMDCPLCVLAGAPPSVPSLALPVQPPLAQVALPLRVLHVTVAAAAPPPARGPPVLS